MYKNIFAYSNKPELYAENTAKFWDDAHISKGMLEAHLNPDWDSATRNYEFIDKSVEWISSIAPASQFPKLLDIGCGPGIYAEKFFDKSYHVTGIDISERSIAYAKESTKNKNLNIHYQIQNYLEMDFENEFDIITLIYCDFGVLSTENRNTLLQKIYKALKPNGRLIFDVFTAKFHEGKLESKSWEYCQTGFWNESPHICLHSFYRYDECATILNQNIIITENTLDCYNIWEHTFTAEEMSGDLEISGFSVDKLYGNVAGDKFTPDGEIICCVAKKEIT